MVKWLLIFVLFCPAIFAADITPYKHSFGGNAPDPATRNTSVTWLVERFDQALVWSGWGPAFFDSLLDTADNMSKFFIAGPYASSQELNLYNTDSTLNYDENLTSRRVVL